MIIGIDIRTFVTSQLTGVGIYTWEILNQLFKEDSKNHYKLFYNQAFGKKIKQIQDFKNYSNVNLHYYRLPNKILNLSLKYLHQPLLDKIIGGCELFWFPNLNFWEVSNKVKTIITIHDLSFVKMPWAYSPKMKWWHRLIDPQKKLLRADKIVAVSHHTKNDLIRLYQLPPEKIQVIYSGITEVPGAVAPEQIRKKYNLPHKFILFLGTLEPRKNVEGAIAAFELLNRPDLALIIIGGQGWLYKKIYRRANQSKFKDKIRFIGYVQPTDRYAFYQLAELFVWPSFYEGFGFPPLEAMKMGCPVITSANSSLPEVVGGVALLVDPYNVKEIALAMNQLLNDNPLRQRLINKGYQQAEKYQWSTTAKKMVEIFDSLRS